MPGAVRSRPMREVYVVPAVVGDARCCEWLCVRLFHLSGYTGAATNPKRAEPKLVKPGLPADTGLPPRDLTDERSAVFWDDHR